MSLCSSTAIVQPISCFSIAGWASRTRLSVARAFPWVALDPDAVLDRRLLLRVDVHCHVVHVEEVPVQPIHIDFRPVGRRVGLQRPDGLLHGPKHGLPWRPEHR